MESSTLKKVLITGADGALGTVVASRYLQTGCEVTGTYLHKPSPQLENSQSLHWIKVNLTDPGSIKLAFAQQEFDAWVHCAGGFRYATVDQLSDEDLNFLVGTNLLSAFYLARELVPGMKKRNFGRIVFISSRATLQPTVGMGAYSASKAGLNSLTSALADETRSFDITVNAVLPSIIDTPANRKDMPNSKFSDWVSPNQLAEIIFSLTSPWGKPFHGALIPVSGRV